MIPVLPLPALATPMAAAPANAAQVGWAALFARVNNRATPALLQKWMGVGPQQAELLMSELIKRNIIYTPVAGSAVSVQPMYPTGGFPGRIAQTNDVLQNVRDTLDTVLEDDAEDGPSDDTTPDDVLDEPTEAASTG